MAPAFERGQRSALVKTYPASFAVHNARQLLASNNLRELLATNEHRVFACGVKSSLEELVRCAERTDQLQRELIADDPGTKLVVDYDFDPRSSRSIDDRDRQKDDGSPSSEPRVIGSKPVGSVSPEMTPAVVS